MTRALFFVFLLIGVAYGAIDLRVNPALSVHGQRVRVSVIDGQPTNTYNNFFDYNQEFQDKWKNFSLHSVLTPLPFGTTQTFQIGSESVQISIPAAGAGVEGIMFGDPCIYHTDFELPCMDIVGHRLPALVNAVAAGKRPGKAAALDYWTILGDNFYDRTGHLSAKFFSDVTLQAKSIPLLTVPGNHDYWIMGSPDLATPFDQYGKGFMQYYGQDVYSGRQDPQNFLNFSKASGTEMPQPTNFFQYTTIGNIGFIKYSGAYDWADQESMFQEACTYLSSQQLDWLFVLGHWSSESSGCAPGMDVPNVVGKLATVNGCSAMASRTRGFFGHSHCNKIITQDSLYMIGGTGFMEECQQAGFVYLSTLDNRLLMVLFDFGHEAHFTPLLACLQSNPIAACTHLGTTWVNATAVAH